MTPHATTYLEILNLHRIAAEEGDETKRLRLFKLLSEMEWALPKAKAEVNSMYGADQ